MPKKNKPNNDPDSVALRMRLKQEYLPDRYPIKTEDSSSSDGENIEQFAQQHASAIEKRNDWLINKINQYQKNVK